MPVLHHRRGLSIWRQVLVRSPGLERSRGCGYSAHLTPATSLAPGGAYGSVRVDVHGTGRVHWSHIADRLEILWTLPPHVPTSHLPPSPPPLSRQHQHSRRRPVPLSLYNIPQPFLPPSPPSPLSPAPSKRRRSGHAQYQ